ncbi:Nickel transport system permease protein nikB [Kluyvera cryocrescens]|uniref:Nickel transport system permease protein nikB n=1 Tax=Kluyvera cryocrescens TaxID=580 RepID=A0A485A6X1_KLUCR|nr:Nickel transport system permease protein nikB [Kluyvera cryocrescens]
MNHWSFSTVVGYGMHCIWILVSHLPASAPVLDDMLNFLPATLELAGAALVLILFTSVPLGIWGRRAIRDRLPDFVVRIVAFLGVSMPNFWLAFLLVMVFSVYWQWFTGAGLRRLAAFSPPPPCR